MEDVWALILVGIGVVLVCGAISSLFSGTITWWGVGGVVIMVPLGIWFIHAGAQTLERLSEREKHER